MSSILNIKNVNKNFGKISVLNDININIDKGDFLVLVGPSGCGKSTLLNCIAGLEKINTGDIFIDNKNMSDIAPKDRDIAMVFQSYALYPTMTVEKNITFGMKVRGLSEEIQQKKLIEVSRQLQIENLLKRKPGQLSGGQRQRVAMGRALVRNPKLFLFDEPLSNLDAKLRVEMRTEIKKLHYDLNASMVLQLSINDSEIEGSNYMTVLPDPNYGFQLQDNAVSGVSAEGAFTVLYEENDVVLNGGEIVKLRQPTYLLRDLAHGPLDFKTSMSPRVAQPMIGLGLLEAIHQNDILKLIESIADYKDNIIRGIIS